MGWIVLNFEGRYLVTVPFKVKAGLLVYPYLVISEVIFDKPSVNPTYCHMNL